MKLICHPLPGFTPQIRPAPLNRAWMDGTPERFAYRCLPLNIANLHGWEMLCPVDLTAVWDGTQAPGGVKVISEAHSSLLPVGHFGSGVLTFHLHCLLRTEPGYNLWVTGPTNAPKDSIQPLSGVVETDWAPYSFTMNWIFTRPHAPVRFVAGEPLCFFFPVPRGLVEQVEPVIVPLADDPQFAAQHQAWAEGRNTFISELPTPGTQAHQQGWQKGYFQGRLPDGRPAGVAHHTKLNLKPFKDGGG